MNKEKIEQLFEKHSNPGFPGRYLNKETFSAAMQEYASTIQQQGMLKYPIGGYAPGSYQSKCVDCNKIFVGDKRAVQCEPCATSSLNSKLLEALTELVEHVESMDGMYLHGVGSKEKFQKLFDVTEAAREIIKSIK